MQLQETWVYRTSRLLNATRKAGFGNITVNNGAVPGTLSSYMTVCVKAHVPSTADIVLVEYSINDQWENIKPTDGIRLSFERLIRKLLDFPRKPAVVLVHTYLFRMRK